MAKIFGIAPIELRPGVNGADFEKFFREEYAALGPRWGWKGYVLKGDRGENAGKYAVIWEIPSVDLRDRYIPKDGEITEEGQRLLGPEFQKLNEKLDTFVQGWPFTDYVELDGKTSVA